MKEGKKVSGVKVVFMNKAISLEKDERINPYCPLRESGKCFGCMATSNFVIPCVDKEDAIMKASAIHAVMLSASRCGSVSFSYD